MDLDAKNVLENFAPVVLSYKANTDVSVALVFENSSPEQIISIIGKILTF